ncbi:hypothetical protein [Bacillus alkalicellulosilyticus]|uniref:hypothetical protein n=1 Tax=Alkalihalobacterium alkalicellulosilyticum TaxID=1912214 RepID=UPI0009978F4D|nr:hypothetical protein [Bacillus alkalicellulosilyticus]
MKPIKKLPYLKTAGRWVIFVLLCCATAMFIYAAIFHEIIYRLFVICLLLFISYSMYSKRNHAQTVQSPKNEFITTNDDDLEKEIARVNLGKTQMLETLFTKAELDEAEKQAYRDKIMKKDTELFFLKQDVLKAKMKLEQAMNDTKKYFSKSECIKELSSKLQPDVINKGSMMVLNEKLAKIRSTLDPKTIQSLEKLKYVDESFKITRNGYKALKKICESRTSSVS